MWWQAHQQFHHVVSPVRADLVDPEAHGHSPRRRKASKDTVHSRKDTAVAPPHTSQGLTAHPAFRARDNYSNDPFWSQHGPMHDPFTGAANPTAFYKNVVTRNTTVSGDPSMHGQSRSTSASHDDAMPDYSRPLSPASSRRSHPMPDYSRPPTRPGSRSTSGSTNAMANEFGLSRLEMMLQSHPSYDSESQFEAMMAGISPRRDSNQSGISAPSNTRANSAANSPPTRNDDPFVAAKDRAYSNRGHSDLVPVASRDLPTPTIRLIANTSKESSGSLEPDIRQGDRDGTHSETAVKKRPVGRPKGRKEGRLSETAELEIPTGKAHRWTSTGSASGKENAKGSPEKISDGKRKRVASAAGPRAALEDRVADYDTSSPTRKVSRTGPKGNTSVDCLDMDYLTAEGVVTREPLAPLENQG